MSENETIADIAARDVIAGERPLDEMLKAPLPIGNLAAMRKALEKCRDLAEMLWLSGTGEDMSSEVAELKDTINAALSAPPRNCDVGTAEEQDARFVKWRYSNPLRAELGLDALAWAQMPYEPDTKKEERNDAE